MKYRIFRNFWFFFWLALIILGVIYIYLRMHIEPITLEQNGKLRATKAFLEKFEQTLPQNLHTIETNLAKKSVEKIGQMIDTEVDRAFEGVYAQVPAYSDFHFSLKGEYSELSAALTRELAQKIKKELFDKGGFNLEKMIEAIKLQSGTIVGDALIQSRQTIQKNLGVTDEQLAHLSKTFSQSYMTTTAQEIGAFFSEHLRIAGIGTSAAVAGAVAATAGKKVVGKLGAKVAVKTGTKIAASLGSGATATAACAPGGPFAAVCGITAGIVTWFVTDKIIIELDQYLNEESFKKDLITLLDTQKNSLKTAFRNFYANQLHTRSERIKEGFKNKQIIQLIQEKNR